MATLYSAQYQRIIDKKRVKSNEWHGRVRVAVWTMSIPLNAVGDIIYLVRLPVGARILKGMEAHTALGDGGGAPEMSIGTPTDLTRYLGAMSFEGPGTTFFANTIALGMGTEIVAGSTDVVAITSVDILRFGESFRGWIQYVLD